ncbi:DUF262 domain-containing protein [Pontiellaceae bacterium B12227]|nr:DUF262 domain-containing protein [Pontiellaceae bacterium B12227]
MARQYIEVNELVKMIEGGTLQLPEIQRRYVWQAPRVRDLIDSLYRSYPSGSILVWQTNEDVPTQSMAVEQNMSAIGRMLLLDGQQRLTSLTAVLQGKLVSVRGRKKPIDILFNLEHPEVTEFVEVEGDEEPLSLGAADSEVGEDENGDDPDEGLSLQEQLKNRTFVVSSKAMAQLPNWVSVTEVFSTSSDTPFLKKAGVTSLDDPLLVRYTTRLQKLRNIAKYSYEMHVLESRYAYEEVAEIFVRVNSSGMKLRSSDLALAQISAKWRNVLVELDAFAVQMAEHDFNLDTNVLVRMIVVFATKQCKFQRVGGLSEEKLKDAWEKSKKGLEYAVNFMRANAGIETDSLLSSPMIFVPLAVYSQIHEDNLTADELNRLKYWLYLANAKGRYSYGTSETLLNEDLKAVFEGKGADSLVRHIKRQFGRLSIDAEDVTGRRKNSPLFYMAYLALKDNGAKDWYNGLGLSLTHQGTYHYIQHHHIFPKSRLKDAGYETSEINEIANLAFIGGDTNRRISNKLPVDYFPTVIEKQGEEVLESQLVPVAPELRDINNYRQFLEERREELACVINTFILKSRGIKLDVVLERLVDEWDKERLEHPEEEMRSAAGVTEDLWNGEYSDGCAYLEEQSNSMTISEVIRNEVMNIYGGLLWSGMEGYLNKLPDSALETMNLEEFTETFVCGLQSDGDFPID